VRTHAARTTPRPRTSRRRAEMGMRMLAVGPFTQ
jgi:hypothetical protein